MPKIDPKLPLFTRSGRPIKIISTEGRNPDRPIIGYIGSYTELSSWHEDGTYHCEPGPFDLVQPDLVQPCELWVNIYDSCTATFPTKDAALRATKQPIARIKVAYTPGQFD
ncbi:MAG TPA: hypothetical protein PLE48_14540 [Thiobacillus sp.]|uniref:hypothetical protein n=1 Tax=Acidovorax sp. TaxID=1872122 RepID=UPI00262BA570|nr:hypothetical protein [Acidovorax sp.]HQT19234.1 hypothetical protein [Acidovorax defluvii]HQT71623.1 hypothetical protein [Thiobacillus sp.]